MILLSALLLLVSQVFAQTSVDSLQVEIDKATGTQRIDLVITLAERLLYADKEKGLNKAEEALDLSRSIGYRNGEASAYSLIGTYYNLKGEKEKAHESILQGLSAVEYNESLPVTGVLYSKLGDIYNKLGMYDEAIEAMRKSLPLLELDNNIVSAGYVANFVGYLFWQKSDFDSSLVYYHKALVLREELGDAKAIAVTCNNIGIIYYQWSNYEEALEYYLDAVRFAEEFNVSADTSIYLNNIGITYRDWGKYDEALTYFNKALEKSRNVGNSYAVGYSLNNIGTVYEQKGDYTAALDYYRQSLDHYSGENNKRGILLSMNSLSGINNRTGNYNEALKHAEAALKLAQELQNTEQQTTSLMNAGVAYMYKNRFDLARQMFDECLTLSRQMGKQDQIKEIYLRLSELNERMGNMKSSLNNYKLYSALKDSIFNEKSLKTVNQLKIEYETEVTNRENELLRITNLSQESIIRRNRTINILFGVLLVMIAISSIVFYRLFMDKRKANTILAEKNDELSQQRDHIEMQKEELETALSKIKVLGGLLPICANCKKIRDDSGYWDEVELYISKHSEAIFSHGICPDCMKKLYPEYIKKNHDS